jgi:hypothetical protein
MTPTLYGRWQTRWFLLFVIGFPVTFLLLTFGWIQSSGGLAFWILIYLGFFGIFWDILYDRLQQFMWDHDWPGLFQFFANILEGLLFKLIFLPFLSQLNAPGLDHNINIQGFIIQYVVVSVSIYLLSWMVMRLLFPRWRFRGGEWLGQWPKTNS